MSVGVDHLRHCHPVCAEETTHLQEEKISVRRGRRPIHVCRGTGQTRVLATLYLSAACMGCQLCFQSVHASAHND